MTPQLMRCVMPQIVVGTQGEGRIGTFKITASNKSKMAHGLTRVRSDLEEKGLTFVKWTSQRTYEAHGIVRVEVQ